MKMQIIFVCLQIDQIGELLKNTNMKILKKIGQIIISVLLFIFGLPLFCLYGISIGIWDLIEIILFYNSKRDEKSTLVR